MSNYDWKNELINWTENKRRIQPYKSKLIELFEAAFNYTYYPDKSLFGSNNSSLSLLAGGIYFIAITKEGDIWLLLDKNFANIPNSDTKIVKSSHKFPKPLYWLKTKDYNNISVLISTPEIWKSFKNATKKIFNNKIVTAHRDNISKNKHILSEFWNLDSFHASIYSPTDIIWFKNVTNEILGEAYLNTNDNLFVLDFPTKHRNNVLRPLQNELILLYQKINGVPAFTHIVTPVDDLLIENNSDTDFRYGRLVKVIAKTNIQNLIPVSNTLWQKIKLSGVTQGNACKIENMKSVNNLEELQFNTWNKFSGNFVPNERHSEIIVSSMIDGLDATSEEISVSEGKLKLISHKIRERNSKIIKERKQKAIRENKLFCEVCTFSFRNTFGKDFIECHHIVPISSTGIRETTLNDLSLVCSNCHRMLHLKFDNKFLTVEELAKRLKEQ